MFHYRALIITIKASATLAPHYGTVYHAIQGTQSLWRYLNVRSITFFKSNARHSRKTAFSVIVYSLNFKRDMDFYGLMN